jgi:hypothetical protein
LAFKRAHGRTCAARPLPAGALPCASRDCCSCTPSCFGDGFINFCCNRDLTSVAQHEVVVKPAPGSCLPQACKPHLFYSFGLVFMCKSVSWSWLLVWLVSELCPPSASAVAHPQPAVSPCWHRVHRSYHFKDLASNNREEAIKPAVGTVGRRPCSTAQAVRCRR